MYIFISNTNIKNQEYLETLSFSISFTKLKNCIELPLRRLCSSVQNLGCQVVVYTFVLLTLAFFWSIAPLSQTIFYPCDNGSTTVLCIPPEEILKICAKIRLLLAAYIQKSLAMNPNEDHVCFADELQRSDTSGNYL